MILSCSLLLLGSACRSTSSSQGKSDEAVPSDCQSAASEALKIEAGSKTTPTSPLSSLQKQVLCAEGASPQVGACIRAARKTGISHSDILTACKTANEFSEACLTKAREVIVSENKEKDAVAPGEPLGSQTAAMLCMNASAAVNDCTTIARTAGISGPNTYTICQKGFNGSGPCVTAATRTITNEDPKIPAATKPLGPISIPVLCSTESDFSGPCIEAGRKATLSTAAIASICKAPNEFSAACIEAARPTATLSQGAANPQYFRDDYVMVFCINAQATTAQCINDARTAGTKPAHIVPVCRPPSP